MISPSKKAQQLIDEFLILIKNPDCEEFGECYELAKKCALKCCNEVLGDMGADRGYVYWFEVKKELENI